MNPPKKNKGNRNRGVSWKWLELMDTKTRLDEREAKPFITGEKKGGGNQAEIFGDVEENRPAPLDHETTGQGKPGAGRIFNGAGTLALVEVGEFSIQN